jgi:hypothetical protein
VEQNKEKLIDLVRKGYSIAVFPEGTRSEDCSVLRFHRGAFYLAEMLQLDIVPVLLHGAGHVLPKQDFILRKGSIAIQVHPRIAYDDSRYGSGYVAQSKQIRRFYKQAYASLAQECETAAYFKNLVFYNYLYKGFDVERSVRKTLKKINTQAIDDYQGAGPVLVVNNGYGEFSFLFALVHKQIQVMAVESDSDRVRLAQSCAGIPGNLTIYEESELPGSMEFVTVYLLNPDEMQREKQPDAIVMELHG